METVNVVCIKWGNKFPPHYVNNLYHMVKRNITFPLRFICLTEDSEGFDEGVDVLPLPNFQEPPQPYLGRCLAWRKLALFADQLYDIEGKVLFLDLDVVIYDNIDCFFHGLDKVMMPENWSQPGRKIGQASIIGFVAGKTPRLLKQWEEDAASVYKNYRTEQEYIPQVLSDEEFAWYPDEWVKSFKAHCLPAKPLRAFVTPSEDLIPKGAKVIAFHGDLNMPQAIDGDWGSNIPWYKKWYKTVKPTPWVKKYWY